MFEAIFGFVILYIAFHVIKAVLAALRGKSAPPKTSPPSPPPAYRSPRDTTARPAPGGAAQPPQLWAQLTKVAQAAKAARAAQTMPNSAARRPPPAKAPAARVMAQRQTKIRRTGPFVIERRRRFPWLAILTVAAILALLYALGEMVSAPPRQPPTRQVDGLANTAVAMKASSSATAMTGPVGRSKAAEAIRPAT